MNCDKCGTDLVRDADIWFGGAQYEQWKCPTCNTIQYCSLGVIK